MKKVSLITGIIILGLLSLHLILQTDITTAFPAPTDRASSHNENLEFKQKRKEWLENMHRAAPGVNWREIEKENLRRKAEERFARIRSQGFQKTAADFAKDTVAGGLITGHWREVGSGNQAGRNTWAEYDPAQNKLILSTAGGNIWEGDLQGSQWQIVNNLRRIPGLNMLTRLEVAGGQRLIAASGSWGEHGLRYSDDGGLTWNLSNGLGSINSWGRTARVVVVPDSIQTIYLLAYEWNYDPANWGSMTSLYRSVNQGVSFAQLTTFASSDFGDIANFDIWADKYEAGDLYLLENHRVYSLAGNSNSPQLIDSITLTTSPGNAHLKGRYTPFGTVLYALYESGNSSHIYRSLNGGSGWTFQGTLSSGLFSRLSFEVSSVDPNFLYAGGVNCFRSADGGANWTLVNEWYDYYPDPEHNLHADIPAINSYFDSAFNEFVLINTDGGTYVSYDQLQTVKNINLTGMHNSQYYSTYTKRISPHVVFAGAQDQGYQRALNDNYEVLEFDQLISGDYGHIVSGDSGKSVWTNYPGFTMFYPNAASSTQQFSRDFDGDGHLWLPPLLAHPSQANKAFLGGGSVDEIGANIIELTAIGNNISMTEQPFDFSEGTNASISAMGISPQDDNFRYVMTDNEKFFYSIDGGQNWTKSSQSAIPGSHLFYGNVILPDPSTFGRIYLGGSGYSNSPAYVSHNHGVSFTPINNGLPSLLIYDMDITPDGSKVFAATSIGPYVYLPSTSKWYPIEALSAPDQTYWSVEFIPALNVARFGTYGRGIWDFAICDSLSAKPLAEYQEILVGELKFQFINESKGGMLYEWDFGDGTTSTGQNPQHTYSGSGVYEVKLITSTFCESDTFVQTFYLNATSAEDLLAHKLEIFPNPSHGKFSLRLEEAGGQNYSVNVISMAGQLIYNQSVSTNQMIQGTEINLQSQPKGVYVLRIQGDGKITSRKIIIR